MKVETTNLIYRSTSNELSIAHEQMRNDKTLFQRMCCLYDFVWSSDAVFVECLQCVECLQNAEIRNYDFIVKLW